MSDSASTASTTPAASAPAAAAAASGSQTPPAAPATGASAAATAAEDEDSKEEAPSSALSTASLYVGELNPSISEAILFEIFSSIGPVTSIRVCRDAVSHESLGYAYVNFNSQDDAKKAMEELNYAQIKGRPCRIMWSQRDPSVRKSGKGNVFVKNLDPTIDNKGLHDTFSEFGDILSCKVVTSPTGQSLGFGFIHFATAEAAEDAISTMNGMKANGRELYVAYHVPKSERESQAEVQRSKFTNVYVKNLPESVADKAKLEEIFSKFGTITSAVLALDSENKSKGFGFVNYESHESAQKAVDELNDSELDGKKLYVGRAQTKHERQNELKKKYDAQRMEQLTKYQGVNLYVKNLEDTVDNEKLKEAFAPFGTITSARVMTDDQGKSRGFGFVCYSSPEEANKAISEMNQHILGTKPLYVALAQRKDVRHSQMRQQLNARNQLRLQQQAAVAGGLPPQFVGAPMVYPGQPPFINGAPAPGVRVPYPPNVNPQMMIPRGMPPLGQWQNGPRGAQPRYPTGPAAAPRETLEQTVAAVPEEQKKQVIGEALYPKILAQEGIDQELAGKITGMLLDMDNRDLFVLSEDDAALKESVQEAKQAYNEFLAGQQQQ